MDVRRRMDVRRHIEPPEMQERSDQIDLNLYLREHTPPEYLTTDPQEQRRIWNDQDAYLSTGRFENPQSEHYRTYPQGRYPDDWPPEIKRDLLLRQRSDVLSNLYSESQTPDLQRYLYNLDAQSRSPEQQPFAASTRGVDQSARSRAEGEPVAAHPPEARQPRSAEIIQHLDTLAQERARQRERRADPAVLEQKRAYERERYHTDPEYRAQKLERQRERQRERRADPAVLEQKRAYERERYHTDPEYRAQKLERQRERRADPAVLEQERAYQRERYHTDPEYRAQKLERQRERRADPAVLEQERAYQRERRADPAVLEQKRAYQRERYHTDPEHRAQKLERQRERRANPAVREQERAYQRERYHTDPEHRAQKRERERERQRERRADPE